MTYITTYITTFARVSCSGAARLGGLCSGIFFKHNMQQRRPCKQDSTTFVCCAVMLFMMAVVQRAGALGAREAVKVFLASWVAYVVCLRWWAHAAVRHGLVQQWGHAATAWHQICKGQFGVPCLAERGLLMSSFVCHLFMCVCFCLSVAPWGVFYVFSAGGLPEQISCSSRLS